MNTLSFGVQIAGAPQAKNELREILAMQEKLNKGNVLSGINPATVMRSPELLAELRRLTAAATTSKAFPFGAFLNQSMGIGAGRYSPGKAAYQAFWQSAVPPQLVPPVIPKGINWRQAGLGALAAPFSPWVSARALSGSGIFGDGIGGAGGAGGLGGLFGAGGMGGFAAAFVAVKVATEGLRLAFEHLKNAVEQGSKLYQQSARTAVGTGKLFQLQAIGQAIGLDPSEIQNLIVRGEHRLRGGGGATLNSQDLGQLFGSGRGTAQIGDLQQIKNMSEDIRRAWKDMAPAAYEWSQAAKPLQEFHYQLVRLATEWKTAWAEIATAILPMVKLTISLLVNEFQKLNLALLGIIKLEQFLHLIPKGDPGKNIIPTPVGRSAAGSPWERMGFVVGGFVSHDYAKKTADNTTKIAESTNKISKSAEAIMNFFGGGKVGGHPLMNLP